MKIIKFVGIFLFSISIGACGMSEQQKDLVNGLLHIAAFEGHPALLPNLFQLGADVNAKNGYGRSPLFLAVSRAHTEAEHQNDDKVGDYLKVIDILVNAKATLSHVALSAGEKPFDGSYNVNSELMSYLENCKMRTNLIRAPAEKDIQEQKGMECESAESQRSKKSKKETERPVSKRKKGN